MQIELSEAEQLNREQLAGWWDLLGRDPEYPASTSTVAELLSAVDYVADPDVVIRAISEGWLPPPPKAAGRHYWRASDIVQLATAMESRRAWKPFSKIHGHKLTQIERLHQVLEHRGQETFNDLAQFDYEGLLGMLHSVASDAGAVQIMTEALRQKLRSEGII